MVARPTHSAIAIGIGILLSAPGLSMPHSVAIKSVTVDKDGQWMSKPYADISREQCATFRLPGRRAAAWFKRSNEISFHEWNKMDVSPCYAEGKITTTHGKVYTWFMDDVGRAQIYLSKTKVLYLSGPDVPPSEK
ncbi:hypothetical protein ACSBM8_11020 [Sphingomonas sp. ASY06-1R]|jgi:hypothetical protein|uniref:hypothetical protein n=1 Tax=Sphingomonas sp. ASY06-1R TaxID=3445771 RepID=UPI003FA32F2A